MAFVITSPCATEQAASCVDVCPVEAIYHEHYLSEEDQLDFRNAKIFFGLRK